ncbi:MAG: COX15/CtaA family protein [Pseudomonadota bacterium]|nr:COX15/CtaA family protein [Pseudomonadota bacterium]
MNADADAAPALGKAFFGLAAVTYGLLVFGASVRVHGAGLSCPDWPLCFGELIPTLNFEVFLEWGHRVLASAVSLGFLVLGVAVLRRPALRARAGGLLLGAALVLATQVVLGGLTVLHLLADWSVTLHLLTGNLFCALLLLAGLKIHGPAKVEVAFGGAAVPPAVRVVSWLLAGALVVQMMLGGLVSSNYAGLACTEWPTCNGGVWFPVFDGIVGLQIFHRLGAYTLLALSTAFWVATRGLPALRRPAALVFGLVLLQAAIGVTNVLLAMPVEIAIAHSAVADLIVLGTTWALWRVAQHPIPAPGAVPTLSAPEHA